MNKYVSRGLIGVCFVGGLWACGTVAANAATTTGTDSIASGTQVLGQVTAPVTATGNAISIIGHSTSTTPAPATAASTAPAAPAASAPTNTGTGGILSGTQGIVSVAIPVHVTGNAISVAGQSTSTGAAAPAAPAPAPAPASTSGSDAVASGTQALVDLKAPVTVSGNAVSVLGDSNSTGSSTAAPATSSPAAGSGSTTTGDDSVASGTQIAPDVAAPVTVGGNAISILGDSSSTGSTTAPTTGSTPAVTSGSTTGDDSLLGGTQALIGLDVPITVTGNGISVLGDSSSTGSTTGTTTGMTPTTGTGSSSTGDDGIASGTQVAPDVTAPVTVGGNAISVIGDTNGIGTATTPGSTTGTGSSAGNGSTTAGDDSVAGGTQITPVITAPRPWAATPSP